jgi:hypothetical protein
MFDDQPVNIPCQTCGAITTKTVGWIKLHDNYICRCDAVVKFERRRLPEDVPKTEKKLDHLFR